MMQTFRWRGCIIKNHMKTAENRENQIKNRTFLFGLEPDI